jgi:hypothetical protein
MWRAVTIIVLLLLQFFSSPAFFLCVKMCVNKDDVLMSAVLLYYVALLFPLFTRQAVRQTVSVQLLKLCFIIEAKSRHNNVLDIVVMAVKQTFV